MKGPVLLAFIAPALCATSCGVKVVTETAVVYVTCTAGQPNCGPPVASQTAAQPPAPPSAPSAPPVAPSASVAPSAPLAPVAPSAPAAQPSEPPKAPSSTPDGPSNEPATYNPLPEAAIFSTESPGEFMPLQGTPGMTTIINSCDFDLTLNSVGCGDGGVKDELIAAGETFTEPLRKLHIDCAEGGVSLKVTSANHSQPVQAEYTVDKETISYDISFLDCMVRATTDLSPCAGWAEGHQCGGGKGSPVWACKPSEYCDRTSYTVAEYGLTKENQEVRASVPAPVGSTELSSGIVWEICAINRKA